MAQVLDLDEHVGEKDLSGHRVLTLDNGNKIHVKKHDPYGFWTVNYDKGTMPDRLRGQYTSFYEANRHVQAYLAENDRKVVEVFDSSEQPGISNKREKGSKWPEAQPSR